MSARSRVLFFPDGRRVEVDPDYVSPPRPRVAIHGVKEPFRSMADGKIYDDTRTYEREVKARGYEIVGNESKPFLEPERPRSEVDMREVAQIAEKIGFGE